MSDRTLDALTDELVELQAKLAAVEKDRDDWRALYMDAMRRLEDTRAKAEAQLAAAEAAATSNLIARNAAEANLELSRTSLEMSGRCDRCGVQWNPANYGFCPVCAMDLANKSLEANLAAAESKHPDECFEAYEQLQAKVAAVEALLARRPHLEFAPDAGTNNLSRISVTDDPHYEGDCARLGGACAK